MTAWQRQATESLQSPLWQIIWAGTAVNYAKVGATSGDLVTAVQSDAALRADVESAEVIMVSVGVNDLIAQVLYENTDLVDLSNCSTLIDVANKLTTDTNKLDAANKKLGGKSAGRCGYHICQH